MLPRKIDEVFSGLSNVFIIADDILIADFDWQGRDHEKTLENALQVCRQAI